jgi:hypothetical protein
MRDLFTVSFASIAIGLVATLASPVHAGQGTPGLPTLKDTLEKGLRARRPEEFAFIALVVEKVNDGSLPLALVDSTFLWARKRDTYPFQYFQEAIRVRAKKIGVDL